MRLWLGLTLESGWHTDNRIWIIVNMNSARTIHIRTVTVSIQLKLTLHWLTVLTENRPTGL